MARSLKKGPYIDFRLENKINGMNTAGKKSVIKTWSRRSMISPDFVGQTFAVHNGNKFIPVFTIASAGVIGTSAIVFIIVLGSVELYLTL